MKRHVIHAKFREEFRVFENLQNQGFEVFLPICHVQKILQGKIKIVTEPLFNRYLFIRFSDDSSNWSLVRSIRGVAQLLRFDQDTEPVATSDSIVAYLKQRCSFGEPFHQFFQSGDLLEITKGPFAGLLGSFEKLQKLSNVEARALVLIEI